MSERETSSLNSHPYLERTFIYITLCYGSPWESAFCHLCPCRLYRIIISFCLCSVNKIFRVFPCAFFFPPHIVSSFAGPLWLVTCALIINYGHWARTRATHFLRIKLSTSPRYRFRYEYNSKWPADKAYGRDREGNTESLADLVTLSLYSIPGLQKRARDCIWCRHALLHATKPP